MKTTKTTNLDIKKCVGCHDKKDIDELTECDNCHELYCESCLPHHITSTLTSLSCHICDRCFQQMTSF